MTLKILLIVEGLIPEAIANLFRIYQTEEKLKKDNLLTTKKLM